MRRFEALEQVVCSDWDEWRALLAQSFDVVASDDVKAGLFGSGEAV